MTAPLVVDHPPRGGARERARLAMTREVAGIAVELFAERGYDSTTVEDICAAAGISRTSFFRYFRTKEEVLLRDFDDLGTLILSALVKRPDRESAWTALRHAITPLAAHYDADGARTRRILKIVIETPSLFAFHQDKLARWVEQLRPEIARRLAVDPADAADPAPTAIVSAAFACMDAALTAWVGAAGRAELETLLDRAMLAVHSPR
jgi:AcrR family transcriptional regulator